MEQNINNRQAAAKIATRACLACGSVFAAESPYLRICPACKESEEWQSGNVDITLHDMKDERKAANDN
jgi:uncharacterized OB-fold protein